MWRDEIYDLAKSLPQVDPKTGRIDKNAVTHIRNQVSTLQWLAVELLTKGLDYSSTGIHAATRMRFFHGWYRGRAGE